jgi:hypothetical protein
VLLNQENIPDPKTGEWHVRAIPWHEEAKAIAGLDSRIELRQGSFTNIYYRIVF